MSDAIGDIIVNQMFTQETVDVYESVLVWSASVIRRIAGALTAPNVIVKKLCLRSKLCISGAQALCVALESNSTVKELVFHGQLEDGCPVAWYFSQLDSQDRGVS
jgi:hypothetical protein